MRTPQSKPGRAYRPPRLEWRERLSEVTEGPETRVTDGQVS